jgi:hypothetical protein
LNATARNDTPPEGRGAQFDRQADPGNRLKARNDRSDTYQCAASLTALPEGSMTSDNIAGRSYTGLLRVFLLPGQVIQWLMYMTVGNTRGYGKVRQQTRLARSPIMKWVYSPLFWLWVVVYGAPALLDIVRDRAGDPAARASVSAEGQREGIKSAREARQSRRNRR